ncbi:hypothetical protein HDU82_007032, partial [Entophlyctis luteolus]
AQSNSLLKFYSSPPSNILRGMAFNDRNKFQLAFCGTERTGVLDSRFPKTPLYEWNIEDPEDPPVGIQVVHAVNTDAIVTWNKRHGRINFRPIPDGASLVKRGPMQTHFRPQRIPSFHTFDARYMDGGFNETYENPQIRSIRNFQSTWRAHLDRGDANHLSDHENGGGSDSNFENQDNTDHSHNEISSSENSSSDIDQPTRRRSKRQTEDLNASSMIPRKRDWEDSALFRRRIESAIPPWPGLVGIAFDSALKDWSVDVFQCSADGTLYHQQFKVFMDGEDATTGVPCSDIESGPASDWILKVEKEAIADYENLPHFEKSFKTFDVFPHIKYFTAFLLNLVPTGKRVDINSGDILPNNRFGSGSQTAFELFEFKSSEMPILYTENQYPKLLHLRSPTNATELDLLTLMVSDRNNALGKKEPEDKVTEFGSEDFGFDIKEDTSSASENFSLRLRQIPINLALKATSQNDFHSIDELYTVEHVRQILQNEFFGSGRYYPAGIPTAIEKMENSVSNMKGPEIASELLGLKNLTQKNTLDWIAKDVFMAGSVIDCRITTTEGPTLEPESISLESPSSDVSESDSKDVEVKVELDRTVKTLINEVDLNSFPTATIHGPLFLKAPVRLSKEACVLRDKWNNAHQWYNLEDKDAVKRMDKQTKLSTLSKRKDMLRDPTKDKAELHDGRTKKKGTTKELVRKDDLLTRASQLESEYLSSQTKVVSSRYSQQMDRGNASTQSSTGMAVTGTQESLFSNMTQESQHGVSRILHSQSQSQRAGGTLSGSALGSQPMKKKRKSGF